VSSEPIKVYLDSSDYSTLSSAKSEDSDEAAVRRQLVRWVDDGRIRCFFSQVLLAEMAPTNSGKEHHAIRRAELLFELCRTNTMIAPQRLISMELARAIDTECTTTSACSMDGEWFPDGADELQKPTSMTEMAAALNECAREAFEEVGLNRAQRRKAEKTTRRQRVRLIAGAREVAKNLVPDEKQLKQSLSGYPLKAADAAVLIRYFAGHGSAELAKGAYRRSLSDPSWVLEWMFRDVERSKEFSKWLRAPGEQLSQLMLHSIKVADEIQASGDAEVIDNCLSDEVWRSRLEDQMAQVCSRVASKAFNHEGPISADIVKSTCPGIWAMLGTFHSAWRASVEHNRKAPMRSDFGDSLHAIYASYVDIFRADSSMAPHVSNHISGNTRVVSKLSQLVPIIDQLL